MTKLKFLGIIPARYASTRFPGKPLAVGEFYDVEITGADDYDLYGTTGHE